MINSVKRLAAVGGLLVSAWTASAQTPAAVPYFTDFEGAVGAEWSSAQTDSATGFTKFAGRYSNSALTLSLTGLTPGTSYTVAWDLYVIDSWDGNSGSGDRFIVEADGTEKFNYTFSNYNGEPPSQPQTYPNPPDTGRVQIGFNGSFVDAIYRNLEIAFIPTTATATIRFRGANLQDISDESWGIDNVSVKTTASVTQTTIGSTTLPSGGGNDRAIDSFSISATRNLDATTAGAAANYSLREAGADGIFGNGDDTVIALTPSFTAGKTVFFTTGTAPLQPGNYRFTVGAIQDALGATVAAYTRDFTIVDPVLGKIERASDDTIPEATALPLVESPAGSGLYAAVGEGTFDHVGDVDYWRFDSEGGNEVTIRVEADNGGTNPQIYLQNASGGNLVTTGGNSTTAFLQNYTIPGPGTYYLRIFSNNNKSHYRMRLQQTRGLQQESEANNTAPGNDLGLSFTAGSYQGKITGALDLDDSAGDFFRIGVMNVGNALSLNLTVPNGATIAPTDIVAELYVTGNSTPVATSATGALSFTIAQDGLYYLRLSTAKLGVRAEYVANLVVTDGVKPQVASVSLPAAASTSTQIINSFTADFSEDLLVSAAVDAANYELRSAGVDGILGNADDIIYSLAPSYSGGLTVSFSVNDGPIQQGPVRFTAKTGLSDRSGNTMASAFVQQFTVANVAGFVFPGRLNGQVGKGATRLGTLTSAFDGTFTVMDQVANGGNNPWFVVKGDFNGDGKLDIASASYGSSLMSVFFGNGDGTLQAATTYPTQNNPLSAAVGDFNGDGKLDIVVGNHSGSSISVFLNKGDGTFNSAVNYSMGTNPRSVVVGDFNGDGKMDIVTANESSGNVSVRLGVGDGTFLAPVTYAAGSSPFSVITADFNGDGKLDLAVANAGSKDVSILKGNGDGTFQTKVDYPVGASSPRSVVAANFDANGALDLVTMNAGDNSYSFLHGNGDGTFAAAVSTGANGAHTSDPYHIQAADFNGDGKMDFAIASYGQSRIRVYVGTGDGTFTEGQSIGMNGNPIAIAIADFNADGIPDIASANYAGHTVGISLGNGALTLAEDPAGSGIRTIAGRGALANGNDQDHWTFTGQAGDYVTIAPQNPGNPGSSGLFYDLYYANDYGNQDRIWSFNTDSTGWGQNGAYQLPYNGRYVIKVRPWYGYYGEYRFRLTLAKPPLQVEDENNSSTGSANRPALAQTPGAQRATVLGYISVGDGSGDYYNLGQLSFGTEIHLSVTKPSTSGFVPILQVVNGAGTAVATGTSGATTLNYTIPSGANGNYFARVTHDGTGDFFAQYILALELVDTAPPQIVSVTLPAEGSHSILVDPNFSINFTEDMQNSTVQSAASYDLRAAGPDGQFDTADDVLYTVANSGYTGGVTANYSVTDGPMLAGSYRFTAKTTLQDRFGFALAQAFVRKFVVDSVAGFVQENRNNDSAATATSLSLAPGTAPDGSFKLIGTTPGGVSGPYTIASGDLNHDGNIDVVVAGYNDHTLGILLGKPDGTWQPAVTIPMPSNPTSVAIADLNHDNNLDLVVANYGFDGVAVFLGNGDGTFGALTRFGTGSDPWRLVVADFNNDTHMDVAVMNYGANTMSILKGVGDGTFATAVTTPIGGRPYDVEAADVNKDGLVDLVVISYDGPAIQVLLNNGSGGFLAPANYPTSAGPVSVAIGDFNGDGWPDLVSADANSNQLSIYRNKGDGTFELVSRQPTGMSNLSDIQMTDMDGDGKLDLVVIGYSSSNMGLFQGRGDGSFNPPSYYSVPNNPYQSTIADVNHDGRKDVITGNYNGGAVSVLLGRETESLTEDPAGSGFRVGTGRGNLDSSSDVDYFSFSAKAGDTMVLAAENPGEPASSGHWYEILNQDGARITYFYSDSRGYGQSGPVSLPSAGTYFVAVHWWYDFRGEYRFRLSLAPSPVQFETENNNDLNSANAPALAVASGKQTATIAGYASVADGTDYYKFGNLSAGTAIRLNVTKPSSSKLAQVLEILNGAGNVVAASLPNANLQYEIPSGADGAYFARVRSVGGSRNGDAGPYLFFNGSNQHVDTGSWNPGKNYTVEAWVRPDWILYGDSERRNILGYQASCQDWGLVQYGNQLGMVIRPAGGACTASYTVGTTATLSEWAHLAMTSDGVTAKLYLNGQLVNSAPLATDYAPVNGCWIGDNNFYGSIDDAAVWNRALSPEEIQATMTSILGTEPNLVSYWNMEEGTGTLVSDAKGAHNGTAVNNPAWLNVGPATAGGGGLMAQYIMSIELADTQPPTITSVTLPAEGSDNAIVPQYFTIGFSEDMTATTVNNAANYELRSAGPDNQFDTADDVMYGVGVNATYSVGLSAAYRILDTPLQPGKYRFTISTALQDRSTSPLQAPYVRKFNVAGVPGFTLEDRDNDSLATADLIGLPLAGAGDGSFVGLPNTQQIVSPVHSITAADLNNDGHLDVVIPGYGSHNLAVYLGKGDGTFQTPAIIPMPNNGPTHAVAIDINHDGNRDIVTADYTSGDVGVLLGNGDGTFATAVRYPTGSSPWRLVVADFDGDTHMDVAVLNYGANTLSVLKGTGTGALGTPVTYQTGLRPYDLAAADLNKDGKLDLIMVGEGDRSMSIMFNDGTGLFGDRVIYQTQNNPHSVVVGDLDGDGWPDIVTADNGANAISIFHNKKDGTFEVLDRPGTGIGGMEDLQLADLDRDGKLDLIIAGYGNNTVDVLQGLGNGKFAGPIAYGFTGNPYMTVIADFNEDGALDIATGNYSGGNMGMLLAARAKPLAEDPAGSGVRSAWGRGFIRDSGDADNWTFSGNIGDVIEVAAETPGHNSSTGLFYDVLKPDGNRLFYFYTDSSGYGHGYGVLPASGTYYVRASRWYDYDGEYHLRVTLGKPPVQTEYDPLNSPVNYRNDTIAQATPVKFAQASGPAQLTATVLGYTHFNDPNDTFLVGNLSPGTRIQASVAKPSRSALNTTLQVIDKNNAVVGAGSANGPLDVTVTSADPYYVRLIGDVGGLEQQYLLSIQLSDSSAPTVVSTTLPAAGSTSTAVIDRFNATFSEEMNAATVQASGNFELRNAGADGVFGTADDQLYTVVNNDYAGGLGASFLVPDGPLQPGNYRFRVSAGLKDLAGNALSPVFERLFTMAPLGTYTIENRSNDSIATATMLSFTEDPTRLKTAFARGNLSSRSDFDYYGVAAQAGQVLNFSTETPGFLNGTQLYYQFFKADGTRIWDGYSDGSGFGQFTFNITADGNYFVAVRYNNDYFGEYRIRFNVATPGLQIEGEGNDSVGSANTITLVDSDTSKIGTIAGYIRSNGDLDYFKLPGLTAGKTVFLSTLLPATSPLAPTVALYNAANGYMTEAAGGRPFDGVAQVDITTAGDYYAVVRNSAAEGGLDRQYVLNVQVAPTDTVAFPNLQVTSVTAPTAAGILSGQNIPVVFTVSNIGRVATPGSSWVDRVILSQNTVVGDADDVSLPLIPHSGTLAAGASYDVNQSMQLPDGISGSYYVIVQTDYGNAVNEVVLEGDNITPSATTFNVGLNTYPDIVVENLTVTGPVADVFTISWNIANRGNRIAAGNFGERVQVRNIDTGDFLLNVDQDVLVSSIAPGAIVPRTKTVTATAAAHYQALITEDTRNQLFEFDATSHAHAEANTFEADFEIKPRYTVAVSSNPSAGGTVGGGGTFMSGDSVTVTATPNTATLPYQFSNWTENGVFQSGLASYTFTLSKNRSLVANFTLPTFTIAASVAPANSGTVTGTGSAGYGTTVTLTAAPKFGYKFKNWTEGGSVVGSDTSLTIQALANQTYVANFDEANLTHDVTTATTPAGVATVTGGGTFSNGQSTTFTAPASVTQGLTVYTFKRYTVGGLEVSTSRTFSKTFATTDPTTMQFVAEYDSRSLYPLITRAVTSLNSPIPVTPTLFLTLQFNRSMKTTVTPTIAFVRTAGSGSAPTVAAGGVWSHSDADNDTYRTPAIAIGAGMDGEFDIQVQGAQDLDGAAVQLVTALHVKIDATFPTLSAISETPGSGSVTVIWTTDEPATSQIEYGTTTSLGRSSPLNPALTTAHQITVTGLLPDTDYHYKIHSRDQAGNEQIGADRLFHTLKAPDLIVDSITVNGPVGGLQSGAAVEVVWLDRNTGVGPSSGAWFDQLTIVNRTTSQTLLDTSVRYDVENGGDVAAGGTREFRRTLTLPDGVAGVGQIAFTVRADFFNNQVEDNAAHNAESNNLTEVVKPSVIKPYADLQVQNLAIAPSSPQSGRNITVTWNDQNAGNAPINSVYRDRLVIRNTLRGIVYVDTTINHDPTAGVFNAGTTVPRTFTFRLPDGDSGVGPIRAEVTLDSASNIFEYNAGGTGEANNTANATVTSTLSAYPDLAITDISAPASAAAGSTVNVTYTIKNFGNAAAGGPWTDYIFLSNDPSIGGDTALAGFTFSGEIASGDSVTLTRAVTLPQFGTGNFWFVVRADNANQIFESDESNNTGIDDRAINVPANLIFTLSRPSIYENWGANAAYGVVTRNSGTGNSLEVTLQSSNPNKATVPATVTIPAGQVTVTFPIAAVDNQQVDGTASATITASAPGFAALTQDLSILDDDQPTVTVQIAAATVREDAPDGTVQGAVVRNTPTTNPLTLTLVSSDTTRLRVPSPITIPAGQSQVIFPISLVNNTTPDRTARILVSPLVNGYQCVSDTVDVTDDDLPTLSLKLAENIVSEGSRNPATEGTVTRNPVTAQSVTVLLHSEDETSAKAPVSVVIPANVASVKFPISVVNNDLVDGSRDVVLEAYTADTAFGTKIEDGSASAHLTVTDDDGPTLTLTVDSELLSESGTIIGHVRRNTPPTASLVVNLQSQDLTEATTPPSVTIPAGQTSVAFTITGVQDGIADGVQHVSVIGSATGYAPGSVAFNVTDIDLPDLRVSQIVAPATALSGALVSVTWTVRNDGLSTATGPWSDRVYTSTSPDGSANLQLLGQYFRTDPLPVGGSYDRTAQVTLPTNPGSYYIVVVTDAANNVSEGTRRNNTLVSATPMQVSPAYRARVSTDVTTSQMGVAIPMTGNAYKAGSSDPMPFALVTVRVNIKGTRRIIEARADANGNFAAVFQPLSGEAGHVTICADHPGVNQDTVQDEFDIYGIRFASDLSLRMVPLAELTGTIDLQNISDLPLTGVVGTVEGLPPNVQITITPPTTIAPSAIVQVPYRIVAGNFTQELRWRSNFKVTTGQGATAFAALDLDVAPLRAQLVANPGFLNSGMTRGQRRIVAFDVTNTGGAASGPVTVLMPNVSWMTAVSATALPSLAPGDTTHVTIALNPPSDLPLTVYNGSVAVNSASGVGVQVPFTFRAISDAKGDLRVTVNDDYTFHAEGAPKVSGAKVELTDPFTGAPIATGTTDATGIITLSNVPEGSYQMTVSASKHSTYRNPVTIVPGVITDTTAFIDRETVSYHWTVVPTQIEDHYKIVLETVFETEVPVPVVIIENPMSLPLVVAGHDTQFEIRVSNKGLIAAEKVHLEVPEHPHYEIIPLVQEIENLPAHSTMAIPVLIRAKPTAQAASWEMIQQKIKRQGTTFTGCEVQPKLELKWSFMCGPDRRWHVNEAEIVPVYVDESCWDKIKDLLGDKLTGDPRDLLDLPQQLCDIAAVLASCVDECLATIVKMACGVAREDAAGAIGAALGFGNCFCPSLPSLPNFGGGGGGGGGGGTGGGFGGGGGGGVGGAGNPIPVPFNWDYSPDCRPGDTVGGSVGIGGDLKAASTSTTTTTSKKAAAGTVCARVRLRIVQEAVITRAAFLGTLELENGNTDLGLTDIQVTLDIRDEFNQSANDKFGVRPPVLSGITAIDGTGTIGPGATGTAQFTMIPNHEAAPEGPTIYRIGGTLKYKEGDNVVEVPLLPDTITAFPDPVLNLLYFQQRDVYADDPATEAIEPSEPFALGLMVKNSGKGSAIDFKITSAQPQIIENEKGLLIDFKIIGTQVGGDEIQPTLTANLGRIDPGQAKTATWAMISTLQGKFIEYKATFEHTDSLGDARLSLIDSVEIHELIHQFQSQKPGADTQPDFLVNDEPDSDNTPDTVYLSDGSKSVVNLAGNPQADSAVALGHLAVHVTSVMNSGWSYLKMTDPGTGFKLYRVVRSDGLELLVPKNAWTTDRTFPGSITGAIRDHKLHIIDFNSTGAYTLYYRVDDSVPPVVQTIPDLPAVRSTVLASADVVFSEEIDLSTFDYHDLTLTLNGGANLITPDVTIEHIDGGRYRINNLGGVSDGVGNFVLSVIGAGVQDYGGNFGLGVASATWAKTGLSPVITSVTKPASPRNTPVTSIDVTFSKALNNGTFTPADISLTLDDGPNLVGDVVKVEFVSGSTFRLTGLGSVTADNGQYILTVDATGVTDSLGNAGVGQVSVSWLQDVTAPRVANLEQIATNPRNIVVPSLDVEFSEPIVPTSFDLTDLSLTRDGGANLIDGRVGITQLTPTKFRITDFSWVSGSEGTYVLTVNAAGIVDLAGNAGVGASSWTWVMDTTKPPTPTGIAMTPDTGRSATDFITREKTITVTGNVGEDNLRVRFHNTESDEDLGYADINSRAFTKTLTLDGGLRSIRVTAIDAAGNVSDPFLFQPNIDVTPPTVTIAQVTPNPRDNAVSSVDITFSEEIDAAKLTRADLKLTRNAGANLIDTGVSILFVSGRTYRVSGLSTLTTDPGLYELTVDMTGVADVAGNAGIVSPTMSWRVTGANTAPVIDPIPSKIVAAETTLTVNIVAQDFDLPAQTLTYSFGGTAPAGAAIDAVTGKFTWRPTRSQAAQIYQIPIKVTDNGTPAMSASATLQVTVADYAELNMGRDVVLRGNQAHVQLEFYASTPITDITLDFTAPQGQLQNLSIEALTGEIGFKSIANPSSGRYLVTISTAAGQTLSSRKNIVELVFTPPTGAAPTGSSAFLWLKPTTLLVNKLDGSAIDYTFTSQGRVVAIGPEPLLEATINGSSRQVILYGIPGKTYRLDQSLDLNVLTGWTGPVTVTPTALSNPIDVTVNGNVYVRGRQTSP